MLSNVQRAILAIGFFCFGNFVVGVVGMFGQESESSGIECSGICRIETRGANCTGFVVESDPEAGLYEIWTAGHGTGGVGSNAEVVFPFAKGNNNRWTGTVAAKGSGDDDISKIIVWAEGIGVRRFELERTCPDVFDGFLFSHRLADRIEINPLKSKGEIAGVKSTVDHPPERGSSGGPILNEKGKVIGMMIARFDKKPRIGIMRFENMRYGRFVPVERMREVR